MDNAECPAAVTTVSPDAGTDFWQRTHYGFRADNGWFRSVATAGNFRMQVRVEMEPLHQYDQAGLMVRVSEDCWLKTSVEFEPGGTNRLGVVVTNAGYSDWSTQDLAGDVLAYRLRVDREGADYMVFASLDGATWMQLRIARLLQDDGWGQVQCGIYACCPKDAGLVARFSEFTITAAGR